MPIPSQFSIGQPKALPQPGRPKGKSQAAQARDLCRKVRFELNLSDAQNVSVVGTFNDWKPGATPLSPVGGGKWATELSLASRRYEYRFIVDGKWTDDPKAKAIVPNPHGGHNAVLEVG